MRRTVLSRRALWNNKYLSWYIFNSAVLHSSYSGLLLNLAVVELGVNGGKRNSAN